MADTAVKLTGKQKRFAEEYVVDHNGTAAAIRAGYSAHTAAAMAAENLTKPHILAEIELLEAAHSARASVNASQVLIGLKQLAFADPLTFVKWDKDGGVVVKPSSELTAAQAMAIKKIVQRDTKEGRVISIELHDRTNPLKLLGDHLGLFPKVHKVGGDPDGAPIRTEDSGVNLDQMSVEKLRQLRELLAETVTNVS